MNYGYGVLNTEANREAAAQKHGVDVADVNELMDALGGEGDFVHPDVATYLWGEFCGDFHASWMAPEKLTLGNFAAWLILGKHANK